MDPKERQSGCGILLMWIVGLPLSLILLPLFGTGAFIWAILAIRTWNYFEYKSKHPEEYGGEPACEVRREPPPVQGNKSASTVKSKRVQVNFGVPDGPAYEVWLVAINWSRFDPPAFFDVCERFHAIPEGDRTALFQEARIPDNWPMFLCGPMAPSEASRFGSDLAQVGGEVELRELNWKHSHQAEPPRSSLSDRQALELYVRFMRSRKELAQEAAECDKALAQDPAGLMERWRSIRNTDPNIICIVECQRKGIQLTDTYYETWLKQKHNGGWFLSHKG